MLTNDEIRKAVEAAPGWNIETASHDGIYLWSMQGYMGTPENNELIAALASALVELVDASGTHYVKESIDRTLILKWPTHTWTIDITGPNRNENTIRAVLAWLEKRDSTQDKDHDTD